MPASRAISVGDLGGYLDEWRTYLESENKAARTIQSYMEAADQLIAFLEENKLPTKADEIRATHIQRYLSKVIETHSSSTAANRYRSLRQLFRYLAELCREDPEEPGIIPHSPMASMRPPKVGKRVIPVMDLSDVRLLMVKMCSNGGARFEDLRDNAILRIFFETGVRLEEQATMTLDALDLKSRRIKVLGKGDKERWVKIGPRTALALSRYLRVREGFVADRRERLAHSPVVRDNGRIIGEAVWVGFKGTMTPSGIGQVVRRRAKQAGIEGVHPHRFRHTWAHLLKKKGVTTEELMELAGWSTDTMPRQYGFSAAAERALETAERLRLGDDI